MVKYDPLRHADFWKLTATKTWTPSQGPEQADSPLIALEGSSSLK